LPCPRTTRRATSTRLAPKTDWIVRMARVKGAAVRPAKAAAAPFPNTRVDPDALAEFRRARDARNVSFSILTEELLRRAIWNADGELVGLRPADVPLQEELHLKSA
jgi:hypothetical protein